MDDRNTLFRKARSILTNHGMHIRDAGKLVSNQMKVESRRSADRQGRKGSSAGGQGGKTPPVVLIDDLCEGLRKQKFLSILSLI